jgi:hypothetical protein
VSIAASSFRCAERRAKAAASRSRCSSHGVRAAPERIQQAIVEIDDDSSGFLQFVVMAFRADQRSHLVHRQRDPLLAYAAPNADPVQVGCTYRPLAIC